MKASTSYALSGLAVANMALAIDTNPNATGACNPTQGGEEACGPNGSEAWLNTGLADGSGWNPPFLAIDSLSIVSLQDYYNGNGAACAQYDSEFQASGQKYNINPAILAIIAQQESSCNPDAGGPTPGILQCDPSNCPDGSGSCQYPVSANVDCGASVLRNYLDAANGNAVEAFGQYNGWFTAGSGLNGNKGITTDYPCSDEGKSNGSPQNLNYINEIFNLWFAGLDPYGNDSDKVGSYSCSGTCDNGAIC